MADKFFGGSGFGFSFGGLSPPVDGGGEATLFASNPALGVVFGVKPAALGSISLCLPQKLLYATCRQSLIIIIHLCCVADAYCYRHQKRATVRMAGLEGSSEVELDVIELAASMWQRSSALYIHGYTFPV